MTFTAVPALAPWRRSSRDNFGGVNDVTVVARRGDRRLGERSSGLRTSRSTGIGPLPPPPPPRPASSDTNVASHQKVFAPGDVTERHATGPRGAWSVESAKVGSAGSSDCPLKLRTKVPAITGWKLSRSIMATAHPIRPELSSSVVGGQVALGSGGWDDGTV